MKLATALKLAAKVGKCVRRGGDVAYTVALPNGNAVYIWPRGEEAYYWSWWTKDNKPCGRFPTLARTLAAAAHTEYQLEMEVRDPNLGTTTKRVVRIYEAFNPYRGLRREVTVNIDGYEVQGGGAELESVVDDAIAAGNPAALLDWIEERMVAVGKDPAASRGLILL